MVDSVTTKKPGAKVRGECADGHTTETTAAPGRITWRGQCSDPGCELEVKCTRIPSTEGDGKKDESGAPTSRVRRIKGYVGSSSDARMEERPPAGDRAKDGPAGGEPPAPEQPGFERKPVAVGPDDDDDDQYSFFPGIL